MVTEATKLNERTFGVHFGGLGGFELCGYKVAENFSDKVRIDFAVPAGRLKICVITNAIILER